MNPSAKFWQKIIILSAIIFLLWPVLSSAQTPPQKSKLVYFYRASCSHCKKVEPYINNWRDQYQDKIDFYLYDLDQHPEQGDLFLKFLDYYLIPRGEGGTPAIFIGTTYFLGDQPIISGLEAKLKECSQNICTLKGDLDTVVQTNAAVQASSRSKLSPWVVLGAALIDSINPCAIGVLLFLISFLVIIKTSKQRLLLIGFVYIIAVFLTYLLMGLGLVKLIGGFNLGRVMRWLAAAILMIAGLINLKDVIWLKSGFSLGIPARLKPSLDHFLKQATIPATFLAGILVAAFELPCTGEVYLGILSLVAGETNRLSGYLYLIFYNLIFVMPLVLILILGATGINVQRIQEIKNYRQRWVRLFLGLGMIALALWILLYFH